MLTTLFWEGSEEAGSESGESDSENEAEAKRENGNGGVVPAPSTRARRPTIIAAANAATSGTGNNAPAGGSRPSAIINRKPSIFGPKPTQSVDGDGDGEDEDALTDIDESDADSDIPPSGSQQTPLAKPTRRGHHPLATQIKVNNPSPNGTKSSPSGVGVDHDLDKPYTPVIPTSSGINQRPSMVPDITLTAAGGEEDMTDEEEEEEEEAAAGTMLQKDVVRRESEGKVVPGKGGKGGKGKGRMDRENTEDSRSVEPAEGQF